MTAGRSIPVRNNSVREMAMLDWVKRMLTAKWIATPTIAPHRVPSATPNAPRCCTSHMLQTTFTMPSVTGEAVATLCLAVAMTMVE